MQHRCHAFRDDGQFAGMPRRKSLRRMPLRQAGNEQAEATLVDNYIKTGRKLPWLVYSQQPANVWFSHAIHVKRADLTCTECHGNYGESDQVRVYEVNRISGYSRDIWGHSMSRLRRAPGDGMKMSDCEDCHRRHNVEVGCLGCHNEGAVMKSHTTRSVLLGRRSSGGSGVHSRAVEAAG